MQCNWEILWLQHYDLLIVMHFNYLRCSQLYCTNSTLLLFRGWGNSSACKRVLMDLKMFIFILLNNNNKFRIRKELRGLKFDSQHNSFIHSICFSNKKKSNASYVCIYKPIINHQSVAYLFAHFCFAIDNNNFWKWKSEWADKRATFHMTQINVNNWFFTCWQ